MDKKTSELKRAFMKILYESPNIVKLIDADDIKYPDDLLGTHIFPRLKVDFTEQEQGAYIGVNISYPSISKNELYKNYVLTFLIISHNNYINYKGDSRVDLLGEEITDIFNWNSDIGFALELKADKEYVLDSKHYARELKFGSLAFNSIDKKMRFGSNS